MSELWRLVEWTSLTFAWWWTEDVTTWRWTARLQLSLPLHHVARPIVEDESKIWISCETAESRRRRRCHRRLWTRPAITKGFPSSKVDRY